MSEENRKGHGEALNCEEVEEKQVIRRYLAEGLTPKESEAFERHYFQCDRCFSELQLQHALAVELAGSGVSLPEVAHPPDLERRAWLVNPWVWGLAAAAVLALLILPQLWVELGKGPSSSEQARSQILQQLAQVEQVPPYLPSAIRGGKVDTASERFGEGMQQYLGRDYASAIGALKEVTELDSNHVPAAFYLGICYLLTDEPGHSAEQLKRVVASRTEGYQDEAHWYLAKAYFRLGEIESARTELDKIVRGGGMYLEDARRGLDLLDSFEDTQDR